MSAIPTVAGVTEETEEEPRYLSTGEVVDHLSRKGMRVSQQTVRRWASAGQLACIRTPGQQRRFLASDVDKMLAPAGAVA